MRLNLFYFFCKSTYFLRNNYRSYV